MYRRARLAPAPSPLAGTVDGEFIESEDSSESERPVYQRARRRPERRPEALEGLVEGVRGIPIRTGCPHPQIATSAAPPRNDCVGLRLQQLLVPQGSLQSPRPLGERNRGYN